MGCPRVAAPCEGVLRSFGDHAGVPPFPSSWVEIEVMDAFPESGLFMGSNIFTAAGPPAGGVRQESFPLVRGVIILTVPSRPDLTNCLPGVH